MVDNEKSKVIVYGLGKRYRDVFCKYLRPVIEDKFEIIGVCDKSEPENQDWLIYPFIERSDLLNEADAIIITSDVYYREIQSELLDQFGIDRTIPLDIFEKEIIGKKLHIERLKGLSGVEVGGPSYIFRFLYSTVKKCDGINYSTDTVWWKDSGEGYSYNKVRLGDLIIADAVDLSCVGDETYDFCISSNNLEHIANPIKAICEFKRITKKGGWILILVPRKEECFDHNRAVTSFEHIKDDYENSMDESDLSHLNEILSLHDFSMDSGVSSRDEFQERAGKNFFNRCLHHHVFDEKLLCQIFEYTGISITDVGEIFENYFVLGKK